MTSVDNTDTAKTPSLLTVQEVADVLRVHTRTAYRLIQSGSLKAIKVGNQWRVPEAALLEFIDSGWRAAVSDRKDEPVQRQHRLPLDQGDG